MTADHIDRTAEVTTERVRSKFATVLDDVSGWKHDETWGRDFDRWLAAHDAAVAAKALRDMRDEMSRWEGWDSRDIGHAFLSESVLDTLNDAADQIDPTEGEDQ